MSEEKHSNVEAIVKSVEKVADSKGLAEIGKGLGAGLIALSGALMFIAIYFGSAVKNWDGHLQPQTKCFELQEISGNIYKINTCTGETLKLESELKNNG